MVLICSLYITLMESFIVHQMLVRISIYNVADTNNTWHTFLYLAMPHLLPPFLVLKSHNVLKDSLFTSSETCIYTYMCVCNCVCVVLCSQSHSSIITCVCCVCMLTRFTIDMIRLIFVMFKKKKRKPSLEVSEIVEIGDERTSIYKK